MSRAGHRGCRVSPAAGPSHRAPRLGTRGITVGCFQKPRMGHPDRGTSACLSCRRVKTSRSSLTSWTLGTSDCFFVHALFLYMPPPPPVYPRVMHRATCVHPWRKDRLKIPPERRPKICPKIEKPQASFQSGRPTRSGSVSMQDMKDTTGFDQHRRHYCQVPGSHGGPW